MNLIPIDRGSDMLGWAAQNAVVALVLAIVVAALCRVGRLGPASRHALWLVVLIKLVTPAVVVWPWAIPILTGSGDVRGGPGIAEGAGFARRHYVVSSQTITLSAPFVDEHVSRTQASPELPSSASAAPGVLGDGFAAAEMDWLLLTYGIWIAGALVVGGLNAVRIHRMYRLAKHGTPAPDWLMNEVTRAAALSQIGPPRVAIAEGLGTPVVWSLGRATLLWPAGLVGERAATWRGVILHELAHLRRRDHWTGWLELVAGTLWWFHPVYWYARHQMRENAELACDAWVVRLLPDGRRKYAEALLCVCESGSPAVPPAVPALGVHRGARRSLERRLTMILRERLPVRVSRGAWVAIVLLAVVALPNWYLVAQAQPAAEDARPLVASDAAAEESSDSPPPAATTPVPHFSATAVEARDDRPAQQPALGTELFVEPDGTTSKVPQDRIKQIDGTRQFNVNDAVVVRGPSSSTELASPARMRRVGEDDSAHVVGSDSFTFTRTTYRVPEHVAQRLKSFLEQNLSWPHVMGVEVQKIQLLRAKGEDSSGADLERVHLIITASPTAQEVIGSLVGLMLESKPRDSDFNPGPNAGPFGSTFGAEDEDSSDPFASTLPLE